MMIHGSYSSRGRRGQTGAGASAPIPPLPLPWRRAAVASTDSPPQPEYGNSRLSNVVQIRAPLRVVFQPSTCPARLLQGLPLILKVAFAFHAKETFVTQTIAESYGGDGA